MAAVYPILLDVTSFQCVVIGGGEVAARKVRGFLEAGGKSIVVVAREFVAEFPAEVPRIAEPYQSKHLDSADLVFAATDSSEVNDAVIRDARERGVFVSCADGDDEEPGDFVVPAKLQAGALTVAVSAGSAALSVAIRDSIQKTLDPGWIAMAEAMKVLRPRLLGIKSLTIERRRAIFRDLAGLEAVAVLQSQGLEALCKWVETRHNVSL